MKISVRRGQRIIIDDAKPDWIDDRRRREWRNDRQRHGSLYKGDVAPQMRSERKVKILLACRALRGLR
jgi:hypothetical protein